MTAEITIVTAKAPGAGLWAFVRGVFAWIGFGVLVGGAFAIITSPRPAPEPRACEASQFGCASDLEIFDTLPPRPASGTTSGREKSEKRNPAMNICPCNYARWGAALLAWCIYALQFPQVFFGERSFEAVVQKSKMATCSMRKVSSCWLFRSACTGWGKVSVKPSITWTISTGVACCGRAGLLRSPSMLWGTHGF